MPDRSRDSRNLIAAFHADQADDQADTEFAEWHATHGRCRRPASQCMRFTTADMYVVDADGRCQPEPV